MERWEQNPFTETGTKLRPYFIPLPEETIITNRSHFDDLRLYGLTMLKRYGTVFLAIIFLILLSQVKEVHDTKLLMSGTGQTILPNQTLTPGKAETSNFSELTASYQSQTYSQSHRLVTEATKAKVCQEYPQNCSGPHEIDHLIPVALGGSNDIQNLWAQPGTGPNNFHDKDKLEAYLVIQMKKGAISPTAAQTCLQTNWITCYSKIFKNTYGSTETTIDPDDE